MLLKLLYKRFWSKDRFQAGQIIFIFPPNNLKYKYLCKLVAPIFTFTCMSGVGH